MVQMADSREGVKGMTGRLVCHACAFFVGLRADTGLTATRVQRYATIRD